MSNVVSIQRQNVADDEENVRARKREYQRQWRKRNRERVLEAQRRYRSRNREKIVAQRREERKRKREKMDLAKREWERRNPEKVAMQRVRRRLKRMNEQKDIHLRRNYGITLEAYNEIQAEQGAVCAICRTHDVTTKSDRLFVDHDHETGAVRALLCHRCNAGLGYFKDNIELMKCALSYLEFYQAADPDWDWPQSVRELLKTLPEVKDARG